MKTFPLLFSMLYVLLALAPAATTSAQEVPSWQVDVHYATGALVQYQGIEYRCLQAHTPVPGWEPPHTPALWQPVNASGSGSGCSAAPSVPPGLSAASVSSSGATLSWTAVQPPVRCSLDGYVVYQDGRPIGRATGTVFPVTGLAASTLYEFSVAASDSAGASAPSPAVRVTTAPASGDTGGSAGCATPWNAGAIYTHGMTASQNGANYLANWWTQGQPPAGNSGPVGSGRPWTLLGTCAACSTAPGAPTGLTASRTSATSTTLSWSAATADSSCPATGYQVYQNGHRIGSSSAPSFAVTGLAGQTTYQFSVAAVNATGTSAPSSPISVTTGTADGGSNGRLFAPYVDLSLVTGQQLLAIQQQSGIQVFTLAFITDNGSCQASWGGLGQTLPNDTLSNGTSIASLVDGVRRNGGEVIVSFGGAIGSDLGPACGSAAQVQAMYQSVIDRYQLKMVDFDIEGYAAGSQPAVDLRNQAVKGLKAANPGLIVSYTLPVLPTGLVDTGLRILDRVKASGLDLDVVNIMAMDYGAANDNSGQMGLNATDAASATEGQIRQAGLDATVGITPMIGVNDTSTEIFRLSDAALLLDFARSHGYVSRLSMWSVGRDNGSCPGQSWASPLCSGLSQGDYDFAHALQAF